MFLSLPIWIGLRHAQARRRAYFISFITLISMSGIALGVTVLITVSAVMNGFEKAVRQGILGTVAHATVTGGDGTLDNWPETARQVGAHPEVLAVAPFISGGAMLSEGRKVMGVMLRGIVPAAEDKVAEFSNYLVTGRLTALNPDSPGIILGQELAHRLGVTLGAQVTLITAREGSSELLPQLRRYTLVGLFHFGIRQYDISLALVHLANAAQLFNLGDRVSGLRLKVSDLYQARRIVQEAADIPEPLLISDWSRQNANFFIALAQQRRIMILILGLIIAVAAFNLVSALVMVVTDKAAAIAILRTLGMTPGEIVAVFIVQGCVIGALGTLAGIAAGVTLAVNIASLAANLEERFGIRFLAADVYPIAQIPSNLHSADVLMIGLAAFSLSALATLYPAWRAARLRPAAALRYE